MCDCVGPDCVKASLAGLIAGIVVGVVLGCILLVCLIICSCRKREPETKIINGKKAKRTADGGW
jgi:hypothetical protein